MPDLSALIDQWKNSALNFRQAETLINLLIVDNDRLERQQTSEADVRLNNLLSDNKVLRELLWLNHGCSLNKLYGDDGERQCNNGGHMIDFKRDSAEVIKQKLGGT